MLRGLKPMSSLTEKFDAIELEKIALQNEINKMISDFRTKHIVRLTINSDNYVNDEPQIELSMLIDLGIHGEL